ncbi:MAG: ribose-phosphate pyrophosphokinase [Eubacterium sp.]|nr:ribose-phosphate pyrophosphokinase [Candidatus Colimonas fimequi]
MSSEKQYTNPEAGKLGILVHPSCTEMGKKIDDFIKAWRGDDSRDTYLLSSTCSRFGTGEAKVLINESIRGMDLYVVADVLNRSLEYNLCGYTNKMSPDDIYADIKRYIMAAAGKAARVSVVMPFLYESRQHRRTARESLDSAYALQELVQMGVHDIITVDAHDPRIQNAIPIDGFDNIMPTYQTTKALLESTDDLIIDADHMMVVSPDEGAMDRATSFAGSLGIDVGMFYKRRDYSQVIDGRNPIVAHEFLGADVKGKDIIVIDDMISSGESVIDIARELMAREAKRIFVIATFGIFAKGTKVFDQAYEDGLIYKVITTNGIYQMPELFEKPWYVSADISKYLARVIDSHNHDMPLSDIVGHYHKIQEKIAAYNEHKTWNEED